MCCLASLTLRHAVVHINSLARWCGVVDLQTPVAITIDDWQEVGEGLAVVQVCGLAGFMPGTPLNQCCF